MSEAKTQPRRGLLVRIAAGLAVLLVSVLLSLLIAEGLVRALAPQQLIQIRPDLWQPADSVGWLRRPNATARINTGERTVTVFTDRDGHRVGSDGRHEAATQVLLLGDSFMEALQVDHEQTAARLVETTLTSRLGRPVAVRNAGVAGWSPNQYLARTRHLLAKDRYALVVVAVFVGNDAVARRIDRTLPREPVKRRSLRFPRSLSWTELVQSVLAPLNDGLETRSHLYILAKNQLATLRMRMGVTADYLPAEYRRDEAASPRWQTTAAILSDLSGVAAGRGVPVLFVLVPERFQVYADDFTRYVRGFGIDSTTVDVEQPSRLLGEALRARQLRVVDALPAMRAAASATPERLYGSVDQHLSPQGHRALAAVMAEEAARVLQASR
jgi:hypothetical protein